MVSKQGDKNSNTKDAGNLIANNLTRVIARIRQAERDYARVPDSVTLLAVSKTHSIEAILQAFNAGQRCFGENYLQESQQKIQQLAEQRIEWHFIGPIQSNKTKAIAKHFSWVHSVCRENIAQKLNDARCAELPPLNICLQVNISAETNKSGLKIDQVMAVAEFVQKLPRLKLRGLMAIPEKVATQRPYQLMQQLYLELQKKGFDVDTLSMGMSQDLEIAIEYGATIVRVGTDIFGSRSTSLLG